MISSIPGSLLNRTKGLECGFRTVNWSLRTLTIAFLKREFEEIPKIR
jgi:hypothetical protein